MQAFLKFLTFYCTRLGRTELPHRLQAIGERFRSRGDVPRKKKRKKKKFVDHLVKSSHECNTENI